MAAPGKIHLLLHAHLPFVREPEYSRFLEENWFFEAMAETYLPLLQMLRRLEEKGIPGTLNLSISSSLLAMLTDPLLLERFSVHLHKQFDLIQKEKSRKDSPEEVVDFYYRRQLLLINFWENYCHKDLIFALKEMELCGKLNILTCVGTHPFLPAYQADVFSIRTQLALTVHAFENAFGKKPKGLWLPECGYFEGLDFLLKEFGFEYFFLETHGILLSTPAPKYGVFAPIKTPAGLYAMGREQNSSMEVWSRKTGYPGHPEYREFFRDIAHERSPEYLGDYFMAGDTPIETGFKYYRITGNENKELYRPWNAMRLVDDHARLFILNREATVETLLPNMEGNKVSILCPYDAELFGHWWFEGPLFIEKLFERAACSKFVEMASLESTMHCALDNEIHQPIFSSWGEGGFSDVWMNEEVNDYYPRFFRMRKMFDDLKMHIQKKSRTWKPAQKKLANRYLNQIAREWLLFQASDWAFMIHNKSAADYAKKREQEHYNNVCALYSAAISILVMKKNLKNPVLETLENKNNLFPWIGEIISKI